MGGESSVKLPFSAGGLENSTDVRLGEGVPPVQLDAVGVIPLREGGENVTHRTSDELVGLDAGPFSVATFGERISINAGDNRGESSVLFIDVGAQRPVAQGISVDAGRRQVDGESDGHPVRIVLIQRFVELLVDLLVSVVEDPADLKRAELVGMRNLHHKNTVPRMGRWGNGTRKGVGHSNTPVLGLCSDTLATPVQVKGLVLEVASQGLVADQWFRPEMPASVYAELVADFSATFRAEVGAIEEPLSELTARGVDAAAVYAEQLVRPGPFVLFLQGWNEAHGETSEQRELRLTANYIRHHLTSYDRVLHDVTSEWWVPDGFFDKVWDVVMSEISAKFPELESAQRRGREAKDAYKKHREGIRAERADRIQKQVGQMWDRGMTNGPSWS